LKTSLSDTLNLKLETSRLEEHSSTLENLQHLEEISSTPPTYLEKLQAPCIPPLGNEFPLILQTKIRLSKRFSPFFYAIQAQKPFTIFCSNIIFFLLLGVGP
jgi:hypothetical protein